MRRVYEDVPEGIPPTEVFNIATSGIPGLDKIDYGDCAARLQLNWRPTDGALLYASYNRGIKGGNWSLDPLGGVPHENLKHGEEVLNAYEIGLKTRSLRRQGAAQCGRVLLRLPGLPGVLDCRADAAGHELGCRGRQGGEIEFIATPVDGSRPHVRRGVHRLRGRGGARRVRRHGNEAEFPNAPSVSLNLLARYEWPAFGGLLSAQVDGNWNDDMFLEGTNSEVSFEPSYSVWNASASRPATRGWE